MASEGSQEEQNYNAPQATLDHFASFPWIKPTLEDPAFHIMPMSREVTHEGRGHTLMGKVWNTPSTIPHQVSLVRYSTAQEPLKFPQSDGERTEVRRFYTLGGDLNAHPDLLHGGVIGCIMDSSLSRAAGAVLGNGAIFTVQLTITYKKPVKTPSTIMITSWVEKVAGERKAWARGIIHGEGGVVHALGEGFWLREAASKANL